MTRTQALLAIFLCAPACLAQVNQPMLKADDLHADAAILRSAYEQLHPGLYRYNTRAEMDAHFDALNHQLDHDQTLQDAFLAFSAYTATVRCGHTQPNPLNQPKPVVDALFKSATRLPFYFDWLDRRMIVTRDFTPQHELPPGTEIAGINHLPTATILTRLLTIARADGSNDGKRIAQLAVSGDNEYETFDIYFPMLFPQTGDNLSLQIKRPGKRKTQNITVKPLTFEERVAPIKHREAQRKGGDDPLFEWKDLSDGTAYLKMPTWALYDSKWEWKRWLSEHLDRAAANHAPALILDLRGNEGGNDVGDEIISHLIDAPITVSSLQRLVRYRKVPDDLVPYLDTWDKSFRDWGSGAVELPKPWPTTPAEVTYLRLTRFDDDDAGDLIKPAGTRFHGKVFVLIDATNSSATFQFAQTVQRHRLGTLVGQPTGGSQRGINGGAFFFLRLPHSGIEVDLPLVGTFPVAPALDAGVTPDILVKPTAADIASGHDAVMSVVMQKISGDKGAAR